MAYPTAVSPRQSSSSGPIYFGLFGKVLSSSIVIFRSAETMVRVNAFLMNVLGVQYLDSSPWAINHASLSSSDEGVLMARKEKYLLYLSTNR